MEKIGEFTLEHINDVHTEEFRKNSNGPLVSNPEMIIHPSNCVMPLRYKEDLEKIYNFEVFPDDVWVITYPKSGTTWTQEMVWMLRNKLDYKTSKNVHLRYRCPFIELQSIISDNGGGYDDVLETIKMASEIQRPRCIKSHLPIQLLPKALWQVKPKIIYVSRDPRDVAISYYHHYRLWNGYHGNLDDFLDAFLADRLVYSPYWSHNLNFWNLQDKSHIIYNSYEDMKKDLAGVIRKTAKFLGTEISEEDVEKLRDHLSFNSMKNNDSVNFLDFANEAKKRTNINDEELVFIRKGESGVWASTLSEETKEKFKKWTESNLTGTSITAYPHSSK